MHNNIMAAGLRDRLYIPTTVVVPAVPVKDDSPAVPEHTKVETPMNMSPENKAHYQSEKEAIHLILTGIGDKIYLIVDAYKTAQEIWEAIERLQQVESLNIQDPEWSRFMTIVKQQHKLDEVSFHKLFDILKQYQKEVNELRAERIAVNANPLALIVTAQLNQDLYYQTPKPHKPYAPTSKASTPTRSHATTRNIGKEIAKPITTPSKSDSEEDSDSKQAQRDKDMQKNLALIEKYFKKIYKPTNNNLITSSNSRNKNVDNTPRYKNDNQSRQFRSQSTVNVAGARENVGSPVVQQSGIQCYNYKEFGHFAKECRKPKRNDQNDVECEDKRAVLDNLIANLKLDVDENKKIQKQLKKANTSLAQELVQCKSILTETSKTLEESNSVQDSCLVALQTKSTKFEKYKAYNDRTVDYDKLKRKLNETLGLLAQKDIDIKEGLKLKAYEISVVKEKHDELVKQSLLTKSHYEGLVKEKIKTQNDSIAFVHELKKEMHADLKYVESLKKEIDDLESDKAEFSNMYDSILQECASNDVMCTYLHSLSGLDAHTELQCLYLHKVKKCDCLVLKLSKQTESVSKEVYTEFL
uniref:CCHC-type domain-containing protein n=1 Tax=Tanacetum cinerariifolium TaxID=118510 RepID=A0A6L2MUD0_TANCI|nr:hypothetical protein [Tanacetum cinerariifolium]